MKKLILLMTLMIYSSSFSQCVIKGNPTMKVSDAETYTVENDIAQCKDCHLWVNIGGNTELQGDVKQNTVKLKGTSGGRTVLSLVMLSPQGVVQCSKNIDVLDGAMIDTNKTAVSTSSNCDIDFTDYKEAKTSDGIVAFLPDGKENNYKYDWTVTYENGDQKTSKEKTPQFSFAKDNGIKTATVKITSARCIRNFTKTYEANFWKFY